MNDTLNFWKSMPAVLEGKRILFTTPDKPDEIREATWHSTSPNGDIAFLKTTATAKTGQHIHKDKIEIHDILRDQ